GANDGITDDPLRPFILQYGMQGILVEPQPKVFRRLLENYAGQPNLVFENVAISHTDGTVKLYTVRDERCQDYLASFDEAVIRKEVASARDIETLSVPALSLQTLMKKHDVSRLDILQIDAEGFDGEILHMIDFSSTRPTLIRFEYHHIPVVR